MVSLRNGFIVFPLEDIHMAYTPRPLQDLVGFVFREHKREEHVTLAALQKRWVELVGPGLAERTWPARLQRGLLWITAPDSSWAYQLQFLKQELLGGLRAGFLDCPVTELRFKVGTLPSKDSIETTPNVEPGLEGLKPTLELSRAADTITDPSLRSAFLRAMAKQAHRKREKR